jgi:glycosyltransferase involved in cell wall biosynthesis
MALGTFTPGADNWCVAEETGMVREQVSSRILFVSTYPPTRCGLATFTHALVDALTIIRGSRKSLGVIRMLPPGDESVCRKPEVVAEVPSSRAIDQTIVPWSGFDLLWIQHEYGIFGPDDGRAVVDLCDGSPIPIAVTLHTVPARPSTGQRDLLERLVARSEGTVVMSGSARKRLVSHYHVDGSKIRVIPHGASVVRTRPRLRLPGQRPTIVSWGLVGPGKGIEWSIRAMSKLRKLEPQPRLIVRGVTHPNVKRRQGETYRLQMEMLIHRLGLAGIVEIEDGYMTAAELKSFILGGDIALLPYDNEEQVTSGVLTEAIAAGLPVVATAFPHAVELLAGGAGTVVPIRDPEAIARALRGYLTDRRALLTASAAACRGAEQLSWPRVAAAYDGLAARLLASRRWSVA